MKDHIQDFIDGCTRDRQVFRHMRELFRIKHALISVHRTTLDKVRTAFEDGSSEARQELESYLQQATVEIKAQLQEYIVNARQLVAHKNFFRRTAELFRSYWLKHHALRVLRVTQRMVRRATKDGSIEARKHLESYLQQFSGESEAGESAPWTMSSGGWG